MNLDSVPTELRALAESAALRFLGEGTHLEPLDHSQSLTFRVESPVGRHLLRVHVPGKSSGAFELASDAELESECAWLHALAEDTELVVQRPVSSPDGGFVLRLPRLGSNGSNGTGEVACTLLRWVEGEHVDRCSAEQAARLGTLLAALQDHAQSWARPTNFERRTHDRTWTRTALARLVDLVQPGLLDAEHAQLLTHAVDQLDEELAPHASDPANVGLIHADLHDGNCVFHDGEPRPLDFGLCGFGPWLYDLAECCMHVMPDKRSALVDAYARERGLAEGDMRRLEGYVLAAAIETSGYNASDSSAHASLAQHLTRFAQRHVRRFLDGQTYLFEV